MRTFSLMPLVFTYIVFGAVACAISLEGPQQATARDVNSCLQLSLDVLGRDGQTRRTSFALKLTNTCDHFLSFFLNNQPSYDVKISSQGETVWNLHSEIDLDSVLLTQELQAGQTRAFTVPWNQVNNEGVPVKAGEYQAVGTIDISTDDFRVKLDTEPVTFSINPSP